jgi:glycosyltransferase involved in cell wall biosynthesis
MPPVPLRIRFECPTLHRAGTWFRCRDLAAALARRGHEVSVQKIALDRRLRRRVQREDGFRLIETPRGWGMRFSHNGTRLPSDILSRVVETLRSPVDVVHTFSHHFNAMIPGLVGRAARRAGVVVADWDDLWTEGGLYGSREDAKDVTGRLSYEIDAWSERRLKTFCDAVTVVSRDLERRSLDHGVAPERLMILPNGAPTHRLRPLSEPEREARRRELGLAHGEVCSLFVGVGQYDLHLVFSAFARLPPERRHRLVVLGPNGEAHRRMAEEQGVLARCTLPGFVSDVEMQRWLEAADIGLVPYADTPMNRARFPIKLGDYLAAGLPIVTGDVGEMGRIVREERVGRALGSDVDAFATAWIEVVRESALRGGEWRRAVRGVAEASSWEVVAEALESRYLQWLRDRGVAAC